MKKTIVILVVILVAIFFFPKQFTSSPGHVSADMAALFDRNAKKCIGFNHLTNAEQVASDSPGKSLCYGWLTSPNVSTSTNSVTEVTPAPPVEKVSQINIEPQTIIPGDPVLISVDSGLPPVSIQWDGMKVSMFAYDGKTDGFVPVGVPLEDVVWFFTLGMFAGPIYEFWQGARLRRARHRR